MAALISRLLQQTLEVVYNLQVLHKHGSITTAHVSISECNTRKKQMKNKTYSIIALNVLQL